MSDRSLSEMIASFGKAVITEAVMPAVEKMIPQGAAELGQALYTGSGYMPYGATERPMEIEPAMNQEGFNSLLDSYAARGRGAEEQSNEKGMEQ